MGTHTVPLPVPQPIVEEEECVRHICLEGQLIRVNQSLHCPQDVAPLRCGVLGLAVRVGGDRCCPFWECACESGAPLEAPVSSSCCVLLCPRSSVTSASDLGAPWPQGDPGLNVTSCGTACLSVTLGLADFLPLQPLTSV